MLKIVNSRVTIAISTYHYLVTMNVDHGVGHLGFVFKNGLKHAKVNSTLRISNVAALVGMSGETSNNNIAMLS
jgi:hypothetical protein